MAHYIRLNQPLKRKHHKIYKLISSSKPLLGDCAKIFFVEHVVPADVSIVRYGGTTIMIICVVYFVYRIYMGEEY